ncbi:hypothetical protein AAG589_21150 [Isoptericola sp. F-RaC21]|uniref:hypothetical protein n=1 Tax=Isoptericola sp. F-RaC21 TaxID=3141452 RepID=UPI00315BF540
MSAQERQASGSGASWPPVFIDLAADGNGSVTVAGVATAVDEQDLKAARAAAVAIVADRAADLGRPVVATATTPEGSVRMSVSGAGEVTVMAETPATPRTAPRAHRAISRPRVVLSAAGVVLVASGLLAWVGLTPGDAAPAVPSDVVGSSSPSAGASPSPSVSAAPSPSASPSPSPTPTPTPTPTKPAVVVSELRALAGGGKKKGTARVQFIVRGEGVVPVKVAVGRKSWSMKVDLRDADSKNVVHDFTKVKKGSHSWAVSAPGVRVSGKVWVR